MESAPVVHPLGINSSAAPWSSKRPVAAGPRMVVKFFRCLPGWLIGVEPLVEPERRRYCWSADRRAGSGRNCRPRVGRGVGVYWLAPKGELKVVSSNGPVGTDETEDGGGRRRGRRRRGCGGRRRGRRRGGDRDRDQAALDDLGTAGPGERRSRGRVGIIARGADDEVPLVIRVRRVGRRLQPAPYRGPEVGGGGGRGGDSRRG